MADDYISNLLNKAQEEYPFIAQHDPIIVRGDTGEDYAETWPPYEEGPDNNRPEAFPIDRTGIVIGRPDEFSHHDLAGELLHVDPMSHATREQLMKSWTPEQLSTLSKVSKDYGQTLDEGRSTEDAVRNATDAAIRGHILKQWPEDTNKQLNYSSPQMNMLETLRTYMKSQPFSMKKGGLVDKPIRGGSKLI